VNPLWLAAGVADSGWVAPAGSAVVGVAAAWWAYRASTRAARLQAETSAAAQAAQGISDLRDDQREFIGVLQLANRELQDANRELRDRVSMLEATNHEQTLKLRAQDRRIAGLEDAIQRAGIPLPDPT
jgi:hypothetical protein